MALSSSETKKPSAERTAAKNAAETSFVCPHLIVAPVSHLARVALKNARPLARRQKTPPLPNGNPPAQGGGRGQTKIFAAACVVAFLCGVLLPCLLSLASAGLVRCRCRRPRWSPLLSRRCCAPGAVSLSVALPVLIVSCGLRLARRRWCFARRRSAPVRRRLLVGLPRSSPPLPLRVRAVVSSRLFRRRVRLGLCRPLRRRVASPVSVRVRGRRLRSPSAWAFPSSSFRLASLLPRCRRGGLARGFRLPFRVCGRRAFASVRRRLPCRCSLLSF